MNKTLALVTGASRGIGKAIAIDLASSGLKVIGTATTSEGASRISSYLGEMEIPGMGMRLMLQTIHQWKVFSIFMKALDLQWL